MTTNKKLVVAVIALSLALVCVVGATLAYLVAQSNVVTNTFTYGEISLELAEANKTDKDGLAFTGVVPGDEINKDPTVTVVKGSEPCYVYVLIENQLGAAATYNIDNATWAQVETFQNAVLYRYNRIVDATTEAKDLPVFTLMNFANTLTKEDIAALKDKNVIITAYAHQSQHTNEAEANESAAIWAAGVLASN